MKVAERHNAIESAKEQSHAFIELKYAASEDIHESIVALNAINSHIKRTTLEKGIPRKIDKNTPREIKERTRAVRDSNIINLATRIRKKGLENSQDGPITKSFKMRIEPQQIGFLLDSLKAYEVETLERAGSTMNNIAGDQEASARIIQGWIAGDMYARFSEKFSIDAQPLAQSSLLGFQLSNQSAR